MKKILYFDWFAAGTEFYRSLPLSYIGSADFTLTRSTEMNISFSTLSNYDCIVISRPSSQASLNLIKLAKDMHIKVIADYDDSVLTLQNDNPMWATYEQEKASVIECLALSDEIWVATEAIKKSFRLFNRNIHVVPNSHNDKLFDVKDKRPFTPNKIATYRGGESHQGDMYDEGVPERVISMVNNNPDWAFNFYGQRFIYLEKRCGANYVACGGASTVQFHKMMHKQNAAVFFYPLADTLFNRGKSNCSYLESVYSGSAYFGNTNLPEFQVPGVGDFGELDLLTDPDTMRKMNEVAWEYICDCRLLSKVNELRINRLLNI